MIFVLRFFFISMTPVMIIFTWPLNKEVWVQPSVLNGLIDEVFYVFLAIPFKFIVAVSHVWLLLSLDTSHIFFHRNHFVYLISDCNKWMLKNGDFVENYGLQVVVFVPVFREWITFLDFAGINVILRLSESFVPYKNCIRHLLANAAIRPIFLDPSFCLRHLGTPQIPLKHDVILFCLLKRRIFDTIFHLILEFHLTFLEWFPKHILVFEVLFAVEDLFGYVRNDSGKLIDRRILCNILALNSKNPQRISNFINLLLIKTHCAEMNALKGPWLANTMQNDMVSLFKR